MWSSLIQHMGSITVLIHDSFSWMRMRAKKGEIQIDFRFTILYSIYISFERYLYLVESSGWQFFEDVTLISYFKRALYHSYIIHSQYQKTCSFFCLNKYLHLHRHQRQKIIGNNFALSMANIAWKDLHLCWWATLLHIFNNPGSLLVREWECMVIGHLVWPLMRGLKYTINSKFW